jgi:hypothetical protein
MLVVPELECACQCETHHALTKSRSKALKPAWPGLWEKVQGDTSFDVSQTKLTCSKSRLDCDCRAEIIVLANTSRSSKFAARYSPTDRRRVGYTKLGRRVNLATATALPPSSIQQLNFITMALRSSITRVLRIPKLQGHVAANGILPWINRYRLASAGSPSIARTKSTQAKQLDMATVMVPEDPLERLRKYFTKGTLTRPLVISCLEDAVSLNQPGSRMGEAAIMWI